MSYVNSPLQTNPSSVTFGSREDWQVGVDCTLLLANYSGATPTSPTVYFTNSQTGATVTLSDSPTISGNVVSQRIKSSEVARGNTYQLTLTVVPSTATSDVLQTVLQVFVPGFS